MVVYVARRKARPYKLESGGRGSSATMLLFEQKNRRVHLLLRECNSQTQRVNGDAIYEACYLYRDALALTTLDSLITLLFLSYVMLQVAVVVELVLAPGHHLLRHAIDFTIRSII